LGFGKLTRLGDDVKRLGRGWRLLLLLLLLMMMMALPILYE
jgi:hypothetical protein